MISDIRIRRLNLKVVQRGAPWRSRDDLKQTGERVRRAIMADLDGLLERALAGCAGDERLGTIEFDLTLDGGAADRVVPFARSQVHPQLEAALDRAVATALADQPRTVTHAEPPSPGDPLAALPVPEDADSIPAMRVLALLLEWHAEGYLAQRLDLFSTATIERWLEATIAALDLLQAPPASPGTTGGTEFDGPSPRRTAETAPSTAVVAPVGIAAKLSALVAMAAQWAPFRPPDLQIWLLRNKTLPPAKSGGGEVDAVAESVAGGTASIAGPAAVPRDIADTPRAMRAVLHAAPSPIETPIILLKRLPQRFALQTSLPFLMLGPLGRVGWLDTASALLVGPDEAENAHAFGYALALKALPVPARGWRHAPEHLAAAAFAAGLHEPPHGAALVRMQRALRDDLSALDAMIADALVRGHDGRSLLAVVAVPHGIALIEPDGLFLMALGARWTDVAPVALAAAAPLLVDPSLPAAICTEIDAAGLAFVAGGTPTCGERWHPVVGHGSWRGRTNASADGRAALIKVAVRYGSVAEDARGMLLSLGPNRPLTVGLEFGALDRSVTLAAALALGDICWRLAAIAPVAWAEPEPGLALQRFADLPATMIVTRDNIEIRLPLGPRSRDLQAAGLLDSVEKVPWLERRLCFGVG